MATMMITWLSCLFIQFSEVARTRLREEGNKFNTFWHTLLLVFREDGMPGLYRGLGTQLVRQIPNTAIMMATYEAVALYLPEAIQQILNFHIIIQEYNCTRDI